MAHNTVTPVRSRECASTLQQDAVTEAQPALPPRISFKSRSDEQETLAVRRNASAPGAPAGLPDKPPGGDGAGHAAPVTPVPKGTLSRIDRLLGGAQSRGKCRKSKDVGDSHDVADPLASLKIQLMICTDQSGPPGASGTAQPEPSRRHPATTGTPAEAFFRYAGAAGDREQHGQWLHGHPLHALFNQVYPLNGLAREVAGEGVITPMHIVLQGGISDQAGFYRSLRQICAQNDDIGMRPETLYRNAVKVSDNASGLLREQADFFSRFFSALVALDLQADDTQACRQIAESLRQEWLETDFDALLGRPAAPPPGLTTSEGQTARRQISTWGRSAELADASAMPPRKKQKIDHDSAQAGMQPGCASPSAPDRRDGSVRKFFVGIGTRRPDGALSDALLGDPDFPGTPTAPMPVSRQQLSPLSSETAGAPEPQPALPSAPPSSPAPAFTAHAGAMKAASPVSVPPPRLRRKRKLREEEFKALVSTIPGAKTPPGGTPSGMRHGPVPFPAKAQADQPGACADGSGSADIVGKPAS